MYRMLWHARGRGPRGGSGMGSGARGRMAACRLECISQTIAHTVSETFTPNLACPTFGFRVLTVNSHFRTCLHTPSCLIATRNTRNTRNARNKRTAGGSAHVTTNTGVSKGSAAESGRMGGLKVARGEPGPRGAVVVAARGAVVGGASQAATHRAGSTAMVGGAGACPSFPFLSRQLPPICSRKRGSPASLKGAASCPRLRLRALCRAYRWSDSSRHVAAAAAAAAFARSAPPQPADATHERQPPPHLMRRRQYHARQRGA